MIEVKNLQIKYDDFIAIDDVNFEIKEGEFFTLLGPSGCGKTTTLRAIAGFINPSKGKIFVNGEDFTRIPVEKRELGMIFQSYALFPTMTVFDNIAYGLKISKKSKKYINKKVHELANLVELDESQLEKNVSDLSGGQQQRVAIARAMAKEPKIVLFDEPLSNLDAKLRKQLRKELKRIQNEIGMTAVYVTHDQEEALEISDRIAVFNNGHLEQIGTPREIYDESSTEFVCNFIGDANVLSVDLIDYINRNSNFNLDIKKKHYIREEKIKLDNTNHSDQFVELEVNILEEIFYGTFSKYRCAWNNDEFQVIIKEDGVQNIDTDKKMKVFINPSHILEY